MTNFFEWYTIRSLCPIWNNIKTVQEQTKEDSYLRTNLEKYQPSPFPIANQGDKNYLILLSKNAIIGKEIIIRNLLLLYNFYDKLE